MEESDYLYDYNIYNEETLENKIYSFYEIIDDYDLIENKEIWRNLFSSYTLDELARDQDIILEFFSNNFGGLPKDIRDYIYNELDIEGYQGYLIHDELKEEMKNVPNFEFNRTDIPSNKRLDFYKKRYEYFLMSANSGLSSEPEELYEKLLEYGFDYSVEVIRLQHIFTSEIERGELLKHGFKYSQEKLKEIIQYGQSVSLNVYTLFFKSFNEMYISEEDYEYLHNIKLQDVLIDIHIFNFILTLILESANKYEESVIIKSSLPYNFVMAIDPVLFKIGKKVRKRNRSLFAKISRGLLFIFIGTIIIFAIIAASRAFSKKIVKPVEEEKEFTKYLTEQESAFLGGYVKDLDVFVMRYCFDNSKKELNQKFSKDYFSTEAKEKYKENIENPVNIDFTYFDYKYDYAYAKFSLEDFRSTQIEAIYNEDNLVLVLVRDGDKKIDTIYGEGRSELTEELKEEYEKWFRSDKYDTLKFLGMKYFIIEDKSSLLEEGEYYLSDKFKENILEEPYNMVDIGFSFGYTSVISDYEKNKRYGIIFSDDKSKAIFVLFDKYGRADEIVNEEEVYKSQAMKKQIEEIKENAIKLRK